MNKALIVVDDFLPADAIYELRAKALAVDYAPKEHQGVVYPGVGIMPMDFSAEISQVVGFQVVAKPSFFRMHSAADNDCQVGWIHCDTNDAEFAAVLYLTTDEHAKGGTAFWRHLATGLDAVTPRLLASWEFCNMMNADGKDEVHWDLTGFVGMKFNRFLTYPTRLFHSRYPQQTWGDTKENSRIICAIFYDRA